MGQLKGLIDLGPNFSDPNLNENGKVLPQTQKTLHELEQKLENRLVSFGARFDHLVASEDFESRLDEVRDMMIGEKELVDQVLDLLISKEEFRESILGIRRMIRWNITLRFLISSVGLFRR